MMASDVNATNSDIGDKAGKLQSTTYGGEGRSDLVIRCPHSKASCNEKVGHGVNGLYSPNKFTKRTNQLALISHT